MLMLNTIPRRTAKAPKRPPRIATVHSSIRLTPNMQRIVLTSPEFHDIPHQCAGANLKLAWPTKPGDPAQLLRDLKAPRDVRTYTVRAFDPGTQQLTIDFALHDTVGPATRWATSAKPGDVVGVMGPGRRKLTEFPGPRILTYADMSAIPAIAAILEDLPEETTGDAIFEITSPEDRQDIKLPSQMTAHWLIHADPGTPSHQAMPLIESLPAPDQIAAAGEHTPITMLKLFATANLQLDPALCYIAPYWKIGLVEDEHQILKRKL